VVISQRSPEQVRQTAAAMCNPFDSHPGKRSARGEVSPDDGTFARRLQWPFNLAAILLAMLCSSCGLVSVNSPPAQASVSVVPGSVQLFASAHLQFNAVVQNASNSTVTWQVNSIPGGNTSFGTIDATGMYKAPATVPNQAMVMVTAILQADPSRTASASVMIQPDSSLAITPSLASFTPSQSWQFQVSTPGFSNSDVAWSVDGVPAANTNALTGTISATGLYTAPASRGTHTISIKLIANLAASGTAVVNVTDFPGMITWRNDNARSGLNSHELALAPATVNSATFGKLFSCPIDGQAYAQPLYVPRLVMSDGLTHNVVFVATEKDNVYAFDADQNPCKQLWQISLVPPGSGPVPAPNLVLTGSDITPFIGITGTPVIDPASYHLYVVAKTESTADPTQVAQTLYALNLASGAWEIIQNGTPITSGGSAAGPFGTVLENQRPALLLDNGSVYIAFGGHQLAPGDPGTATYRGWLMAYNASTLLQTGVFSVAPGHFQGGIWQSGGGPSADQNHNVFVLTGDGAFDANRGGSSYSNSALRINPAGGLAVADYFSPCNNTQLGGMDFGASAPLLVDPAGAVSEPHLLVNASKNGSLYIMNRDSLGGFLTDCSRDALPRVQTVGVGDAAILSTPLFWNNTVFVAAGNGKLKAFPLQGNVLANSPTSQSLESFGPQGATPVISYNGAVNANSGAILWLIDSSGALTPSPAPNTAAILRAFDPNNLSNEIYNSAMNPSRDSAGLAVKFTVPTVGNGKVYVGTQTELDVYGLLH
jgi:hypothetical protein